MENELTFWEERFDFQKFFNDRNRLYFLLNGGRGGQKQEKLKQRREKIERKKILRMKVTRCLKSFLGGLKIENIKFYRVQLRQKFSGLGRKFKKRKFLI